MCTRLCTIGLGFRGRGEGGFSLCEPPTHRGVHVHQIVRVARAPQVAHVVGIVLVDVKVGRVSAHVVARVQRDKLEAIERDVEGGADKLQRRLAYGPVVPPVMIALWEGADVAHEPIVEHGAAHAEGLVRKRAILVLEERLIVPSPADAVVCLEPLDISKASLNQPATGKVVRGWRKGFGEACDGYHARAIADGAREIRTACPSVSEQCP